MSEIDLNKAKFFGKGYVTDMCISLFLKKQEEMIFKKYIAECARIITENTAKMGGGSYMSIKFHEIIEPKPKVERSAEDIIGGIRKKIDDMKNL